VPVPASRTQRRTDLDRPKETAIMAEPKPSPVPHSAPAPIPAPAPPSTQPRREWTERDVPAPGKEHKDDPNATN
jgi:hypothetical protein